MLPPRTFALGLVAVTLLVLIACGGSPDNEPSPDQPPPQVDCQKEPQKCR